MERLLEVMRRLRAPDGCPWDRRQTHESLRPFLLEEAAEAVDALASDRTEAVVEELGDVLLQVAFHAVIGEEAGRFGYRDVEAAVVGKMRRRHPHVFGPEPEGPEVEDAEPPPEPPTEAALVRNWQALKAAEDAARGEVRSAAERVPRSLPALKRAAALDAALGWSLRDADLTPRSLPRDPAAAGRLLLATAQWCARQGIDPEVALRDALRERLAEDGDRAATPDAGVASSGAGGERP